MDNKTYFEEFNRTGNHDFASISSRIVTEEMIQLIHGGIGASTEANELLDAIKAHVFYGKPLDKTNLVEEAGDQLWYLSLILKTLGSSLDEAMEKNILKLKKRYPEKFSSESALNRDLVSERKILES